MKKFILSSMTLMISMVVLGCGGEKAAAPTPPAGDAAAPQAPGAPGEAAVKPAAAPEAKK